MVASAITKGTFTNLAKVLASNVFPVLETTSKKNKLNWLPEETRHQQVFKEMMMEKAKVPNLIVSPVYFKEIDNFR